MKKHFLIFMTLTLFLSCSQNEIDIDNDYLFNGRGGIKCEVDGVLLKPSTALVYTNATLNSDTTTEGIPFLTLSFHNSNVSTGLGYQLIRMSLIDVDSRSNLTGNTYELLSQANDHNFGNYVLGGQVNTFETNENFTGELKVLYHDVETRTLGGTFWFDAENSENEIREIRNGEFDMTIN